MEHLKKYIELRWRRYKVDAVPLKDLKEGSYLVLTKSVLSMDDFLSAITPENRAFAKFITVKRLHYTGREEYSGNFKFVEAPDMGGMGGSYSLNTFSPSGYLDDWMCLDSNHLEATKELDPYTTHFGFDPAAFPDKDTDIFDDWGKLVQKPLKPLLVGQPQPLAPILTTSDHTAPYREELERRRQKSDEDFAQLIREKFKEKK